MRLKTKILKIQEFPLWEEMILPKKDILEHRTGVEQKTWAAILELWAMILVMVMAQTLEVIKILDQMMIKWPMIIRKMSTKIIC